MAFKPNYGTERADRRRAAQVRAQERQRKREEKSAQRKADRSAEILKADQARAANTSPTK
jgi:hypothetical protein